MAPEPAPEDTDADPRDELERAAKHRREADLRLSMSERLAALHELCKQASAIRGVAKPE
jgi:hypothetical protein